jgi:hypothetical protein
MDQKTNIERAKDQFNRILGFFPRVEAKASVILAVDTAMLGVIAGYIPPFSEWCTPLMLLPLSSVLLLGVSLWYV